MQSIEAQDGKYRVRAWIKTQNTIQSHIAIVGRNASGKDVYKNVSDQLSAVPSSSLDGTTEGKVYYSREFNPIQWDSTVKNIVIGMNAGWSVNGQPSITWFDNIQLQYCSKVSVSVTDAPLPVSSTDASPTPNPSLQSCGVIPGDGKPHSISSGTFVIGDVTVNGKKQYDQGKEGEGTIVFFEAEGTVKTLFDAGCYIGRIELVEEIVDQQFESGCGSTCSTVRIVTIQSNGEPSIEYRSR